MSELLQRLEEMEKSASIAKQNKPMVILQGKITNLQICAGAEDFIQNMRNQNIGAVTATGLAIAGLAGAATSAMLASGDASDSIEFFIITLDDKHIAGRFSKVFFKDDDNVEVACEEQGDGTYLAYAVRRPADHTLWMYPHCSRGRKAHWVYAWWMIIVLFLSIFISIMLFMYIFSHDARDDLDSFIFFGWISAIMTLIMSFYLSLNTARRWMPFVHIAEKVFTAFGYAKPKSIDMEKETKAYWKTHDKNDGSYFAHPWVFKYVD